MKVLFALFVFSFCALAQVTVPSPPVPASIQLMKYLELSPDQFIRIQAANADYARLVALKSRRLAQVQQEIAEETAKSPLDPMALGLRYAELEAVRRELRNEEAKVTPRVLSILTDAQKTKLKGLEDAMKLQPVICEAQSLRLLDVLDQTAIFPVLTTQPVITGDFGSSALFRMTSCGAVFTSGVATPPNP